MTSSDAFHAPRGCSPVGRSLARVCWLLATIGIVSSIGHAQTSPRTRQIPVELFLRSDSDQCQRARQFLEKLAAERRGLDLRIHDVVQDQAALRRVWDLARRHRMEKAGLPTIYVCDRLRVGFQDEKTTGRAIEELLTLHAFLRQGCPKCQRAKAYLATFHQRWPALRIVEHDVIMDSGAQARLYELARKYHVVTPVVPAFHVGDRFIIGYQGESITGRDLEAAIQNSLPPLPVQPTSAPPPEQTDSTSRVDDSQGHWNPTKPRIAPANDQHVIAAQLARSPLSVTDGCRSEITNLRTSLIPVVARGPPLAGTRRLPLLATLILFTAAESALPPDSLPSLSETDEGLGILPPLPEELPPLPEEPSDDQLDNPQPPTEIRETIDLPFFGPANVNELGMPAFTFLIGLVDGFNPCAMWVLIFLLSILVNIKDRRKILAIAGSFVLVSGLAYFAFMAAWLNVFQLIGLQRKVQILLGVLGITIGLINIKDFFAFRRGVTLSIPESAKPGIYRRVREIVTTQYLSIAIAGAVSLAVVVNVIELFCTAGLPAMYTQVLTMQQLPAWANYGYLALYNVAYMLDDSILLLIAVITLSHRRLQEREGRWLKLLSGLVIFALGLAMVFRPEWLGYSA